MMFSTVLAGLFLAAATPHPNSAPNKATSLPVANNANSIKIVAAKKPLNTDVYTGTVDFNATGGGPGDPPKTALNYPTTTFQGANTEAECLDKYVAKQIYLLGISDKNKKNDDGTTFYWSKGYIVYKNATEAGTLKTDLTQKEFAASKTLLKDLAAKKGAIKAGNLTVADAPTLMERLLVGDEDNNGKLIVVYGGNVGTLTKSGNYWDIDTRLSTEFINPNNAGTKTSPVPAKPAAASGTGTGFNPTKYDKALPFKDITTQQQALDRYKHVLIGEQGGKVAEKTVDGNTITLTATGRLVVETLNLKAKRVYLLNNATSTKETFANQNFALQGGAGEWAEGMQARTNSNTGVIIFNGSKEQYLTLNELKKTQPANATPQPKAAATFTGVTTKEGALAAAKQALIANNGGATSSTKTKGGYTFTLLSNGTVLCTTDDKVGLLLATSSQQSFANQNFDNYQNNQAYTTRLSASPKRYNNEVQLYQNHHLSDPMLPTQLNSVWKL